MTKTADEFFSLAPAKRNLFQTSAPEKVSIPSGSLLPSDQGVKQTLMDTAERYKINPAILFALAQQESEYNPEAVGPDTPWGKAKGMFQFIDTTAKGHGIDAFDYVQAADATAKDLASQIVKRGVDWAIAHHHAGPNPRQHGTKTAKYVRDVLAKAKTISEELGIPFEMSAAASDFFSGAGAKPNADDFFGSPDTSTPAKPAAKKVVPEEDFSTTLNRRLAGDMAETGIPIPTVAGAVAGGKRTLARGWEGIQHMLDRKTTTVERSDDELRLMYDEATKNPASAVNRAGLNFDQFANQHRKVRVTDEESADEEARWVERLKASPQDEYLLPKRLSHLRTRVEEESFAPKDTFKGAMQRIVANHKSPMDLLLQDSIPANAITYLATIPDVERKKFDQVRQVARAMDTEQDVNATPEQLAQSKETLAAWKEKTDPSIVRAWTALWDAAAADPSQIGQALSEALFADPYMLAAPGGSGIRLIRAAQAAQKISAGTKAGRIGSIADRILDGSITTAALNVGAGAMQNLAEFGEVNDSEVKLNAMMGAALGGPMGALFMKGARAKAKLKNPDAARAEGVLDDLMRDAAAADVAMEDAISSLRDPSFGVGGKETPLQQHLRDTLNIKSDADVKKAIAERRAQVKAWFKDNADFADYQKFVAEERLNRAAELSAAAEAKAAAKRDAAHGVTPEDAAARRARFASEYDAAINARNAAEEAGLMDEARVEMEKAVELNDRLSAEELLEATYTGDHPTIKQAEANIARREAGLNRPKWQRGEANPQALAALGITAAGAAAGAAMFPNDQKKGMVAGAILSGLSAYGLAHARGSKGSLGAPKVVSQQGAIKPKGGNWGMGAGTLAPEFGSGAIGDKMFDTTKRYLQRYAGTTEDPLNDLVLPDGTRWEDAMDKAIKFGSKKDAYGDTLYEVESPHNYSAEGRAAEKLNSYMRHVGDYLRTLPESEVVKMDFVRMVKETKRWDDANARKMEKAQVRLFKDAEVLKEYDDGFKWIRLNKPGQFANESDLMGHSVRGYEPVGSIAERLPSGTIDRYVANPDWTPDAVGGHPDYGYGGWDAIKNDQVRVYSLRGPNGKPVATVEVQHAANGSFFVDQVKGPRNEPVKYKYADKVDDFMRTLGADESPYVANDLRGMRQNREAGKADPETLARIGAVGAGAAAGFALFPEDQKLEGTILGGLAGLVVPAGGSVLSRMRQSGAIASDGQIIAALTKANKLATKLEEADIRARDNAWVDAARAGDQQAFKALHDTYSKKIERVVQKYVGNRESWLAADAQDIAQQAFIKAFQKIQEDPNLTIDSFPAYVTTIAQNEAKMALRGRESLGRGGGDYNVVNEEMPGSRDSYEGDAKGGYSLLDRHSDLPDFEVGMEGIYDNPESLAVRDQVFDIMRQELDRMPPKVSEAFTLYHLDNYDMKGVAEKMGISQPTASVHVAKAEGRIKAAIAANRLKLGQEAGDIIGPRGQRGSVDPETLVKTAAVTSAALAGGTAGYFLYDGDPYKTAVSTLFGGVGGAILGGKVGRGSNIVKGDLGNANRLATIIRGVDYRIRDISEALYGRAKIHGKAELQDIKHYNDATAPFIKIFDSLPKEVKPVVIRALSTRNKDIINKMLEHVGGKEFVKTFDDVRKVLDQLEDQLVDLGLIKKTEKDYFPFRVKDLDGLRKALGNEVSGEIDTAIAAAEKKIQAKAGRALTEIEKDIIVNKVLEPYLGKPINAGRPGFSKARTIQEIPEHLQQYYHDPIAALNSYGVQAIKYIERAKFFGKHLVKKKEGNQEFVNISDSIGELVKDLKNRGELSDSKAIELAGMLQDRFAGGEMATDSLIAGTKNLVNASLLGHVFSAATQIGDIVMQAKLHGPRASVKALIRQATRRKLTSLENFGLSEHVGHEFLSDGWTRKVSDWSFKYGGFRTIDETGKNFGLNAAVERMFQDAKTPQGIMRLSERYQRAFPEDFPKALTALKKGEINEAVELLAFTDLTRTQPLTSWELPQMYHRMPNGRVIYHLQTFSLRVLNEVHESAVKDLMTTNPKRVARGARNLIGIGAILGVQGVASDKIKDAMAGKPLELSWEEIPINALEALGMSLYDYNRIADKGPLAGFLESKTPPIFRMSNDLLNEPERSVKNIPVVGRPGYEYFREDLEQRRKDRRKRQGYKMEIKVPPKDTKSKQRKS